MTSFASLVTNLRFTVRPEFSRLWCILIDLTYDTTLSKKC